MGWISYMKVKGAIHKIRKTGREGKRECEIEFNLWVSFLIFLKYFS